MQANAITVPIGIEALAGVQEAILSVTTDIKRLEGLLDHAASNLIERFGAAAALCEQVKQSTTANQAIENKLLDQLQDTLNKAVIEVQFHDMATQLLTHSRKVLDACSDQLAEQALGFSDEEDGARAAPIPTRLNPVTQSEMDAGTIELF